MTDRALQLRFNITLEGHHINHTNSIFTNKPTFSELEAKYANEILRKMDKINARLINQFEIKYQTIFTASFVKPDGDGQILDEIDIFITLGFFQKLTQIDFANLNVTFQFEHQTLKQETKDSGWRFH